jgi:hypothetical protein
MPGRRTGGSSRTMGVEKTCAAAEIGGRGVTTIVMVSAAAPAAVDAAGVNG